MRKPSLFYQSPNEPGATVADVGEVLMAIGRLQEGVDRLRADFEKEQSSAATSRRAIYDKHDKLSEAVSDVKTDVETAAIISAQGRVDVQRLGEQILAHKASIQPSLDEWRRIKTLGIGMSGLLALGGLSVGAMLMMGVDAFKAAWRSWIGG